MKKISILGSTGSVGTQCLDIISEFSNQFEIVSLTAGKNEKLLSDQIKKFKPKFYLSDQEINHNNVEGNLRKIYLKSHENIVFAESFFSNQVIKKIPKFGRLKHEPLGKFLFSDSNIEKRDTYIAIYKQGDEDFIGRKCIYAYQEELFSVIEVFLFHE